MGWIIAGAVVAVILILLMTSVKVRFDYSDPGELRLKISWLFVTLVRIPAKTKKQKRRDKKAEKDVKSAAELEKSEDPGGGQTADPQTLNESKSAEQNKSQKTQKSQKTERGKSGKPPKSDKPKSQKLTLSDIFALVKLVWDSLGKPLKRLLKATRVTGFRLDISVGGDDAADAAIKFGKNQHGGGSGACVPGRLFYAERPEVQCDLQFPERGDPHGMRLHGKADGDSGACVPVLGRRQADQELHVPQGRGSRS